MLSERASSRGVAGRATVRRRLDPPPRVTRNYIKNRLCDYFVTVGSDRDRLAAHAHSPSLCPRCARPRRPPRGLVRRPLHRPRQQGSVGRSGRLQARRDRRVRAAIGQASGCLQLLHRLAWRLQLARPAAGRRRARALAGDAVGRHRGHRHFAARPRARRRRRPPGRAQPARGRARPGRLPASAVGDEQREQPVLRLRPVWPSARARRSPPRGSRRPGGGLRWSCAVATSRRSTPSCAARGCPPCAPAPASCREPRSL